MTKKEYLFKFLDKVQGYRQKEPIIRAYLSKNDDADYTEYLYTQFTHIVNTLIAEKEERKVGSILKYLDKVKQEEKEIQEADQADLKNLEDLINHL